MLGRGEGRPLFRRRATRPRRARNNGRGQELCGPVLVRRIETPGSAWLVLGDLAGGAREAVRVILGDAARGVDTAAERKAKLKVAADAVTLSEMIDRWDKLHLSARRPNYSTAATSALRRAFARHLDRPAVCLDRAAVVRVLDGFPRTKRPRWLAHSPVMAARSMAGPFGAGRFQEIRSSACPSPRQSAASGLFRTTKSSGFGPELTVLAHSTASFGLSC